MNHYATKKSVAESMLDVALFMSNATRLKVVLEQGQSSQYYTTLIALISLSLLLQIVIGILLVVTGKEHSLQSALVPPGGRKGLCSPREIYQPLKRVLSFLLISHGRALLD